MPPVDQACSASNRGRGTASGRADSADVGPSQILPSDRDEDMRRNQASSSVGALTGPLRVLPPTPECKTTPGLTIAPRYSTARCHSVLRSCGVRGKECTEFLESMFGQWVTHGTGRLSPVKGVGGTDQHSGQPRGGGDRKSTRLNSSHVSISYAVFCL